MYSTFGYINLVLDLKTNLYLIFSGTQRFWTWVLMKFFRDYSKKSCPVLSSFTSVWLIFYYIKMAGSQESFHVQMVPMFCCLFVIWQMMPFDFFFSFYFKLSKFSKSAFLANFYCMLALHIFW